MAMTGKNIRDDFAAVCRRAGWKFTPTRFALYCFMLDNVTHPSADIALVAMRRQFPAMSRDSVYRMLNDFARAGMIRCMDAAEAVRFDGNPARHDHFVCENCGRIFDFTVPSPEALLPPDAVYIGQVTHAEIRLGGICRDCMNNLPPKEL